MSCGLAIGLRIVMKTIVSISPARIEADSRTFKQAASIARFGYRSVVVEGGKSNLQTESLPFELFSLGNSTKVGKHANAEPVARTSDPVAEAGAVKGSLQSIAERVGLLKLIRLRHPLRGFLTLLRQYFREYCMPPLRQTPRASLYILHSPLQFPAIYLLSRRYRVPFIYDAHDFYQRMEASEDHLLLPERWLKAFYVKVESLCFKKAAAVMTVSEGLAELHQEAFNRRSVVIRNCQDSRLDRAPARNLRELLDLGDDQFLLVTVGQAKAGQVLQKA